MGKGPMATAVAPPWVLAAGAMARKAARGPLLTCHGRKAMQIEALGYVGVRSDRLDDWATFASGFLGMQIAERSAKSLRLRMDDRKQRLVIAPDIADGAALFGWELSDATALDALAARLEAARVDVKRGNRALGDRTAGQGLDRFHGSHRHAARGLPWRRVRRRAVQAGSCHLGVSDRSAWRWPCGACRSRRSESLLPFYRDLLGFRLSDWLVKPFKAYFFHVNPRHHSLALIETGKRHPSFHGRALQSLTMSGRAST